MMKHGYELWADEVNRAGGLLGRPVRLIIRDDRSSAEICAQVYRGLIDEDRVDFVLSPYGTPNTLAAAAVTEAIEYVLIAAASSSDAVWSRGYERVFGTYALARRYFIGFLDLLAREGFRSVTVVHETNEFNTDAAEGAVRWSQSFGLDVNAVLPFAAAEVRYGSLVDDIARAGADGLVVCTYPDAGYALVGEMQKRGYRPEALAMTIIPVHPLFYERVGTYAEGVFGPSQWEPDERIPFPGTRRFVSAFIARTGIEPSYHAGAAYASCQVLRTAVEAVGSTDHDRLREHIAALDTVTVIGRFKTDAAGRQIGHNSILIQWQDGRKEIVYPRAIQTSPARF